MGESNGNGWKRTSAAALSGGIVGVVMTIGGFIFALGGERQRVIDHVATTEPLRSQAAAHIADREAHLDGEEARTLGVVPAKLDAISSRLDRIERILLEDRRR